MVSIAKASSILAMVKYICLQTFCLDVLKHVQGTYEFSDSSPKLAARVPVYSQQRRHCPCASSFYCSIRCVCSNTLISTRFLSILSSCNQFKRAFRREQNSKPRTAFVDAYSTLEEARVDKLVVARSKRRLLRPQSSTCGITGCYYVRTVCYYFEVFSIQPLRPGRPFVAVPQHPWEPLGRVGPSWPRRLEPHRLVDWPTWPPASIPPWVP
jgi:hypothetical protein